MSTAIPDLHRHALHLGIAEAGKVHALARRHTEALERYREAMRMAEAARAPQVFARHYLYCMLDSLEHLGQLDSVAEIAGRAAEATREAGDSPFHRRDRAGLLERLGVIRLKQGDFVAAKAALTESVALADGGQPLATQLLQWLSRGYAVDANRLGEAQRRHGYWVVRPGAVDPARAIEITPASPKPREATDGR
jgi:tetratricopeptide (TPR) repeat protein